MKKNELNEKINSLIFFEIPAQLIAPGEKAKINACCCYNGAIQKTVMEFEINKNDWLIDNLQKMIEALPKEPGIVVDKARRKNNIRKLPLKKKSSRKKK